MKNRDRVLIGIVPVLLIGALAALAAGVVSGRSGSTPPTPFPTPAPPTHIPEPRASQDTITREEREAVKARRGLQEWGPHTAGTVIEIAGRQVQLPEDVHVETVISEILCVVGDPCPDTPIWVLQRGDILFSISKRSGRPPPGRDIPEAFDFIREALWLSADPHFPQLREDGDVMDALFHGAFVLRHGCLRAENRDSADDYLLIWPQRFKLSVEGQDIRVSDGSGVLLSVGEHVRIGGGEVPLAHVQTLVEQPIPDDCLGPYWIVGEVPAQ